MNIQCFGPLSEDAICKLESALGVTLPGNYREFLKETFSLAMECQKIPTSYIGTTCTKARSSTMRF